MEYLAGGIVFIIFVIVYSIFTNRKWRKQINDAFAGRPNLTPVQFYEQFFMEEGIPIHVVVGVREILEECLDADLSRIQDSDDFSKNLSFFWDYDSMAAVDIICALEKRFDIHLTDQEAQEASTIRDVIELVARKVEQRS